MEKVFEALEILSRALEFNDEGEFQSGRLWRIIFNDMVDDKEKSIIEQALVELKKINETDKNLSLIERCWEIMKKRNVDIYWLRYSDTVEQYNKHISKLRYTYNLTEAEFKTLKEGLE